MSWEITYSVVESNPIITANAGKVIVDDKIYLFNGFKTVELSRTPNKIVYESDYPTSIFQVIGAKLVKIKGVLATVSISTEPPNAKIYIDGMLAGEKKWNGKIVMTNVFHADTKKRIKFEKMIVKNSGNAEVSVIIKGSERTIKPKTYEIFKEDVPYFFAKAKSGIQRLDILCIG